MAIAVMRAQLRQPDHVQQLGELLVYVDLAGAAHFVGRLWARQVRNRESASFEYDADWLANPLSIARAGSSPAVRTTVTQRRMVSPNS